MNCAFCLREAKLSKEHLISRPMASAASIDRARTFVASVDGRTGRIGRAVRLDDRSVRLPCVPCNSGWMRALEHEAADALRAWVDSGEPLTPSGVSALTRWLVKTAVVLAFSENDSRRFLDRPEEAGVPAITQAKAVARGEVPELVVAGAARATGDRVLWGVGNASVDPVGPDRISTRAVNVAALNLGEVQFWVVMPFIPADEIRLPAGVLELRPGLKVSQLAYRAADRLDPTEVIAAYGDEVTAAFQAAMAQLVK